jgi:hypothetical protein
MLFTQDASRAGARWRTMKDLCNQFVIAKRSLVESGELTNRSWLDYKAGCVLIVSHFGKARLVSDLDPDDFVLDVKNGTLTLAGELYLTDRGVKKPTQSLNFLDDTGLAPNIAGAFATINDSLTGMDTGGVVQNNQQQWFYAVTIK